MAKTWDAKLLGGIFLIMGTSIGGGMLALPVTNAGPGFVDSSIFLILCWFVMTMGALLILEINLWFPPGSNIISMAKHTLGKPGQLIAWFSYLFLLYALLCAYIAGGADISSGLLKLAGVNISMQLATVLFVGLFGYLVHRGIRSVDWTTRALIFTKVGLFILLVVLAAPHMQLSHLSLGESKYITGTIMVLITSFGFATIVPSLRGYLDNDPKKLRLAIVIGSMIPLVTYTIWTAVILGVLPREGEHGLMPLLHHESPNTAMAIALQEVINSSSVTQFFRIFSSVCILTSFLGVALSMTDFLADGLKLPKQGQTGLFITALTFIPPVILVIFHPAVFISALSYAGLFCVVLLLLLPVLMAWSGRYIKGMPNEHYQLTGGRATLSIIGASSLGLMYLASQ